MKAMRMIGNARARFTEAKEIERANGQKLCAYPEKAFCRGEVDLTVDGRMGDENFSQYDVFHEPVYYESFPTRRDVEDFAREAILRMGRKSMWGEVEISVGTQVYCYDPRNDFKREFAEPMCLHPSVVIARFTIRRVDA